MQENTLISQDEDRSERSDERVQRVDRRNVISSVFLGILVALAYQEAVPPVRESVREHGVTFASFALFIIFFLTSMRFFIGMQLHLLDPHIATLPGLLWLYDFAVFLAENTTFIFMAGVASVDASRTARFGFIELLLFLYAIDVIWVCSQWLLGKIHPLWCRKIIPWAWALINAAAIISMGVPRFIGIDVYSLPVLVWVVVVNVAAFVVDVVLVDYFDLL